jgi:signal transduction histidine kinase
MHYKVLLASHDPRRVRRFADPLRAAGHRIYTAGDAPAARAALDGVDLDLILADTDLCGAIREHIGPAAGPALLALAGDAARAAPAPAADDAVDPASDPGLFLRRADNYAELARLRRRQPPGSDQADATALTEDLLVSEAAYRRTLGRALHDSTVQSLALVQLRLQTAAADVGPPDLAEQLTGLAALVAECLGELRALLFDLGPASLEGAAPELDAALQSLAAQTRVRWFIDFRYHRQDPPRGLSLLANLLVFQGIWELLREFAPHAAADGGQLRALRDDGGIRLEINLNGDFDQPDPAPARDALRVRLQRRAAWVGGHFEADWNERGLRARFSLPTAPM